MPIRGDECALASGEGEARWEVFSGNRGEGVGKLKVSLPVLKSMALLLARLSSGC